MVRYWSAKVWKRWLNHNHTVNSAWLFSHLDHPAYRPNSANKGELALTEVNDIKGDILY